MFHFRMELYAETLANGFAYLLFEGEYVLRRGLAALVDYYQRLLVVDCRGAANGPFQAALLYHPGSRHLDKPALQDVVRNRVVALRNPDELLRADNRVLEETAGRANLLRIRQFLATDTDNGLAHLSRARRLGLGKEAFQRAIADLRLGLTAEPQQHALYCGSLNMESR